MCSSWVAPIHRLPPHRISQAGLARSFQITNLFRGLSVYENLRLSLQARHPARFNAWRDIDTFADIHAETAELVRFLGLEGIEEIAGGNLSYGGQRLLDMGIALGSKPQILLLDEPLAGLAAAERERVCNLVKSISASIPVLIVEHDIDWVLDFSQRVTVMNQGEILMSGTPEEVRSDRRVQEVYTGTGTPPVVPRARDTSREREILRFEGVNAFYGKSHILNDATLNVREGEIVALLGRNGAGKSTLLKTLAGLRGAGLGEDRVRRPRHRAPAGPGHCALGSRVRAAGQGTVRRHDGGGEPGARASRPAQQWQLRGSLDAGDDFPAVPAAEGAHGRGGGLPVGRRAADVGGGASAVGQRQVAVVGRALRGLGTDRGAGAVPGVRPVALAISIIIVEHNLDLVLALADRVFALERGAVFHSGPSSPLLNDLSYRKQVLWI